MSDNIITFFFTILCIMASLMIGVMIYAICTGDAPDGKLQRIERLEQRCDSLQQQIDFMVE